MLQLVESFHEFDLDSILLCVYITMNVSERRAKFIPLKEL